MLLLSLSLAVAQDISTTNVPPTDDESSDVTTSLDPASSNSEAEETATETSTGISQTSAIAITSTVFNNSDTADNSEVSHSDPEDSVGDGTSPPTVVPTSLSTVTVISTGDYSGPTIETPSAEVIVDRDESESAGSTYEISTETAMISSTLIESSREMEETTSSGTRTPIQDYSIISTIESISHSTVQYLTDSEPSSIIETTSQASPETMHESSTSQENFEEATPETISNISSNPETISTDTSSSNISQNSAPTENDVDYSKISVNTETTVELEITSSISDVEDSSSNETSETISSTASFVTTEDIDSTGKNNSNHNSTSSVDNLKSPKYIPVSEVKLWCVLNI